MLTTRVWRLGLVAALLLLGSRAWASDFVDTRLTFTFGDDNFLADAGETMVDSPKIGFGDRPGYKLFFDALDSQYAGRENLLHLVLYKKMPGFVRGLSTEAAIVVKADFSDARNIGFLDDGTYLRMVYDFSRGSSPNGLKLDVTMFPFSTDRFRVGYLYSLTWGGSKIFPGAKNNLTPGVKVSLKWKGGYAFAGMKTARILTNPEPANNGETSTGREAETFYGVLGGVGQEVPGRLRFEVSGGYFQMGQNPNNGVEGRLVDTYGFSARISQHKGMPIGISADLRLYRTDAEFIESLARKEKYGPGFHYQVAAEGNLIGQTLEDPEKFGSTKVQWGYAGALSGKIKWRYLRAHLTAYVRSLQFILRNVPSFVPYQAFSPEVKARPQVFLAAGTDWYFASRKVTLGGMLGAIIVPASFETVLTATIGGQPVVLGHKTVVVRDEGDFSVLPDNETPRPIYAGKLSLKWDLSDMMSLYGIFILQYDHNFTNLVTLANGTATLDYELPWRVGAMVYAQAKF